MYNIDFIWLILFAICQLINLLSVIFILWLSYATMQKIISNKKVISVLLVVALFISFYYSYLFILESYWSDAVEGMLVNGVVFGLVFLKVFALIFLFYNLVFRFFGKKSVDQNKILNRNIVVCLLVIIGFNVIEIVIIESFSTNCCVFPI